MLLQKSGSAAHRIIEELDVLILQRAIKLRCSI
jgi:hypothetical protein